MMLRIQPRLSELNTLINEVPEYPITAEELVELALEEEADPSVIDFYRGFHDEVFDTQEDLEARTEQVAILNKEESSQPREQWVASEED